MTNPRRPSQEPSTIQAGRLPSETCPPGVWISIFYSIKAPPPPALHPFVSLLPLVREKREPASQPDKHTLRRLALTDLRPTPPLSRPLKVHQPCRLDYNRALHLATARWHSLASLTDLPSGMHIHRAIIHHSYICLFRAHTLIHKHIHAHTRARTYICIVHVAGPTRAPAPTCPIPIFPPLQICRRHPSLVLPPGSPHTPNARQSRPRRHAHWKTAGLTTPGMCCSPNRNRNRNRNKSRRAQKPQPRRVGKVPAAQLHEAPCWPAFARDVSKHPRRDR